MTLMIVASAWMLIVTLVAGMCGAAHIGDLPRAHASASGAWGSSSEPIAISAHAGARLATQADPAEQLVGAAGARG
jgi:hypothetical protein